MIKINYPPYQPKIKNEEGRDLIFDEIRKLWVTLTPEEWVRQNFLQFLLLEKKYPAALIAVEKNLKLGEMRKRFDIVVYDPHTLPWMLIECKKMNVQLDQSVLEQALRYNISLRVPYIVITNGNYCLAFLNEKSQLTELTALPSFGTDSSVGL